MMSEKRFILSVNEDAPNTLDIIDIVADKTYNFVNDVVSMNQAKQLVDLLNEQQATINKLSEENEQLRKIGVMYQGHNPCETCTYCVEDKLCCGIYPPIFCDEMKKDYFVYGLCKKHKQIQKSFRRYDDE